MVTNTKNVKILSKHIFFEPKNKILGCKNSMLTKNEKKRIEIVPSDYHLIKLQYKHTVQTINTFFSNNANKKRKKRIAIFVPPTIVFKFLYKNTQLRR